MKLLVICGPTATGKTKIAASLAKLFNGELINADSRQVYRYMDIATGKDKNEIDVPIWGLDLVDPDEDFSVSQYVIYAMEKIEDIHKRGKLPIVVGGTGFYINALINPPETLHIPPNKIIREQLKSATVDELQKKLDKKILLAMNDSDRNNPRRLIRKIELDSASPPIRRVAVPQGVPLHGLEELSIGLKAPMDYLYKIIDKRVDERVGYGVKKELEFLLSTYSWNLPSMNTLGYIEWKEAKTDNDAIQQWKYDEHAYARRQMTWFSKNKKIQWFDIVTPGYNKDIENSVGSWYTSL